MANTPTHTSSVHSVHTEDSAFFIFSQQDTELKTPRKTQSGKKCFSLCLVANIYRVSFLPAGIIAFQLV